ncbi:MAG: LUD domain-containing protein [Aureliella sp.]
MMKSKTQILDRLKRQIVDKVDLPEVVEGEWIRFDDPAEQFAEMVAFAGGVCHRVSSEAEICSTLEQFEQFRDAKRTFSNLKVVENNVDLDACDDARELENLDFVIYRGEFAVAENGAIFLSDRDLKHRVVFFITQFLVLVVRREDIINNMHEAYARATVPQPGFGLFLSGPSKTADIEQSLVIGAHGCRELNVFVVE